MNPINNSYSSERAYSSLGSWGANDHFLSLVSGEYSISSENCMGDGHSISLEEKNPYFSEHEEPKPSEKDAQENEEVFFKNTNIPILSAKLIFSSSTSKLEEKNPCFGFPENELIIDLNYLCSPSEVIKAINFEKLFPKTGLFLRDENLGKYFPKNGKTQISTENKINNEKDKKSSNEKDKRSDNEIVKKTSNIKFPQFPSFNKKEKEDPLEMNRKFVRNLNSELDRRYTNHYNTSSSETEKKGKKNKKEKFVLHFR